MAHLPREVTRTGAAGERVVELRVLPARDEDTGEDMGLCGFGKFNLLALHDLRHDLRGAETDAGRMLFSALDEELAYVHGQAAHTNKELN